MQEKKYYKKEMYQHTQKTLFQAVFRYKCVQPPFPHGTSEVLTDVTRQSLNNISCKQS